MEAFYFATEMKLNPIDDKGIFVKKDVLQLFDFGQKRQKISFVDKNKLSNCGQAQSSLM